MHINMVSIIIGLCFIALFFLIVMLIDGNRFRTVHYTVESGKIKKEHLFVVLSDLHNKEYGKGNHKLIRKIEEMSPEGILIAGDILTAKPEYSTEKASQLILHLSRKFPVCYGMGNHETRLFLYPEVYGDMGKKYEETIGKAGVRLLKNESLILEDNIIVSGLDLERKYYKRFKKREMEEEYLNRALGEKKEEMFQILLAHNPDYFEEYSSWGADLVLSGHIHGGVMRLPFLGGVVSPAVRFFPKYDGGMFWQNNSCMILSRGLGMHTIPIRIFNPGELVVLHLKPKK